MSRVPGLPVLLLLSLGCPPPVREPNQRFEELLHLRLPVDLS